MRAANALVAIPRHVRAPQPLPLPDSIPGPRDIRFRVLVGSTGWAKLPAAVQARFTKRLSGVAVALYRGTVIETHLSRLGWLLAQALRPFGAPLPLRAESGVAAVVCVSEDAATGGQCWSRLYASHSGFPQVIHSAKAFAGPTGLEEQIGLGIGMALSVAADEHGLTFSSDHYFWAVAGRRFRLPRWLTPGATTVTHRDLGNRKFAFDLHIEHPLFGTLLHQHALFEDMP